MEHKSKQSTGRLLVLDVDGTLIAERKDEKEGITARPGLKEFLLQAHELGYDLAVWSASCREYINSVLEEIWPTALVGAPVFIFTEKECTYRYLGDGLFSSIRVTIKHLSKVYKRHSQYTPERTLVIDNTPSTYRDNYGNALRISTYTDGEDDEFEAILAKLKLLSTAANVRQIDKADIAGSIAKIKEREELLS